MAGRWGASLTIKGTSGDSRRRGLSGGAGFAAYSRLAGLHQASVRAGIPADAGIHPNTNGRLTIAEVAAINELGTRDDHVPSRPFLRTAYAANSMDYVRIVRDIANDVIDGKTTPQAGLEVLGKRMVQDLKSYLEDGPWKSNAPATIKKKGFNDPLVETRVLVNAIDYRINVKNRTKPFTGPTPTPPARVGV